MISQPDIWFEHPKLSLETSSHGCRQDAMAVVRHEHIAQRQWAVPPLVWYNFCRREGGGKPLPGSEAWQGLDGPWKVVWSVLAAIWEQAPRYW